MEGLNEILKKLSLEDVEKLRLILAIGAESTAKDVIPLRVFCEEYREYIKSNRTNNYYKSVVASLKHLVDYFGLQRTLNSITYKDVELFVTDLQQNVNKGYRVYYRTLKAAFNKAVDWNYIELNHFVKVKLPKKNKLNPLFLNETEVNKILQHIEVDIVKDVVVFAFNTGMRISEIINLKWQNVDFEKRIIVVGDEEFVTKSKNQRIIPFSEEVEKILLRRKTKDAEEEKSKKAKVKSEPIRKDSSIVSLFQNDKGYVFGKRASTTPRCTSPLSMNVPYTGDYFSRRFKRACRKAGMSEAIHFHTLRHSFASSLAQKGVSLYVIKELLGHSSITTTEIYSHLNVDSLREAINKLGIQKSEFRIQENGKERSEMELDARCEIGEVRKEKTDASAPLSMTGRLNDRIDASATPRCTSPLSMTDKKTADKQVRNDKISELRLIVNNRNN